MNQCNECGRIGHHNNRCRQTCDECHWYGGAHADNCELVVGPEAVIARLTRRVAELEETLKANGLAPETIREELRPGLELMLTPAGIERWWETRMLKLGTQTPSEILARGQISRLRDLVASYAKPMGAS